MIPEIVFSTGMGGNHVRWLLSIDPKFDLPFCTGSIDDKVSWICQNVYKNRTWNNWLLTEWKYTDSLDSIIKVNHELTQPGEKWDDINWLNKKQLLLTTKDNTITAYHYFMVNIGYNNQNKEILLAQFDQWDTIVSSLQNGRYDLSSKKVLLSDCVADPLLDAEWYKEIVGWAGYDNLYEPASRIQAAYYECRQQAAQDFITYFESKEFQSHLDFYKNVYIKEQQ